MRVVAGLVTIALLGAAPGAQEKKPVPKDSARVSIPGCTKGYIFTAGPRTVDEPGSADIREGMHIRMNGPKKVIADIKAHEGSMIEITGLMKRGQYDPGGVSLGGGVSMSAGPTSQAMIDVEGWRQLSGSCPSR